MAIVDGVKCRAGTPGPVLVGIAVAGVLGCATTPEGRIVGWQDGQMTAQEVAAVLEANPLGALQNVRVTPLQRTERSSCHLVQIRVAEVPHVHERHDLTVFVVRGSGDMVIGQSTLAVKAGDVIQIAAGTRHYFTNRGPRPAVAVAVFSPPFDGQDTVPVP